MAIFSKELLSGSTNGRGIKVAASATPGTLVHTVDASAIDEVWLFAANSDTSPIKVTVEFGGVSAPDDLIEVTVPSESGLFTLVAGLPLTGGVVVRIFAASINVVMIHGYVNRIT